jgi:hypothetical protein
MLALVRPSALKRFSTLDPLITMSINQVDEDIPENRRTTTTSASNFLSRAARMLKGRLSSGDALETIDTNANGYSGDSRSDANSGAASPSRSETSDLQSTAAATLEDGALPVREFPNSLLSEPASMAPSVASSFNEDDDSGQSSHSRRKRSSSIVGSHQEELRCVIAIIRRKLCFLPP